MQTRTAAAPLAGDRHRVGALTAWRRTGLGVLVMFVTMGVGGMALNGQLVFNRFGTSLTGAAVFGTGYLVAAGLMFGFVVWWQRRHGESLRELGWRRPTTRVALAVAVVYGLAWTAMSLVGRWPDPFSWQRLVMLVTLVPAAAFEDVMGRGFVMEQLRRGGVPTLVQVLVSGITMGLYHGVIGFHFSLFYALVSSVLFGLLSGLFVLGRRSLTPVLVAHLMTHLLADPLLTRGILQGIEAVSSR